MVKHLYSLIYIWTIINYLRFFTRIITDMLSELYMYSLRNIHNTLKAVTFSTVVNITLGYQTVIFRFTSSDKPWDLRTFQPEKNQFSLKRLYSSLPPVLKCTASYWHEFQLGSVCKISSFMDFVVRSGETPEWLNVLPHVGILQPKSAAVVQNESFCWRMFRCMWYITMLFLRCHFCRLFVMK